MYDGIPYQVKQKAGDRGITAENVDKSQHTDFNENTINESASVACSNVLQSKQMGGFLQSWSKEGTARHCQSKKASIGPIVVTLHHEETRELSGERDNARNNARCTHARKTTHGLDGQHQDVDRTPRGRVNQNDRG